jgi:putative transposase
VHVKGEWKYLYRAVDKGGQTIDFLLTPQRDRAATEAFLGKAIRNQGLPEKITIDQSCSNTAAIKRYNRAHRTGIAIRQCKYLNKIVEQDSGTRSSSRQTAGASDAGLQVLLGRALYDRWY